MQARASVEHDSRPVMKLNDSLSETLLLLLVTIDVNLALLLLGALVPRELQSMQQ